MFPGGLSKTPRDLLVLLKNMNVNVKVTQSCPTLCDPVDQQSVEFSRPEYWSS